MAHVRVPCRRIFARTGPAPDAIVLRAAVGILVLLVSVGLHVAFVVTGFRHQPPEPSEVGRASEVAIEVREPSPRSRPPPPKEPEPEVKPERAVRCARRAAQSGAQPKEPPRRSRAGGGFELRIHGWRGAGEARAAFGVGNTRMGETAKTAAPPRGAQADHQQWPTTVKPVANAVARGFPWPGWCLRRQAKEGSEPEFPPT